MLPCYTLGKMITTALTDIGNIHLLQQNGTLIFPEDIMISYL